VSGEPVTSLCANRRENLVAPAGAPRHRGRAVTRISGALLAAALLAGCGGAGPDPSASIPVNAAPAPQARAGISPSGATIALVSLSGAPASVTGQLGEALTAALAQRDIRLAGADEADYLARGYVSAFTADAGSQMSVIWDIYGADRQRRRRLGQTLPLRTAAPDPWSAIGEATVRDIAGRSAEELAAFLTNTPEAAAAARR